jgi:hypothetical protein
MHGDCSLQTTELLQDMAPDHCCQQCPADNQASSVRKNTQNPVSRIIEYIQRCVASQMGISGRSNGTFWQLEVIAKEVDARQHLVGDVPVGGVPSG